LSACLITSFETLTHFAFFGYGAARNCSRLRFCSRSKRDGHACTVDICNLPLAYALLPAGEQRRGAERARDGLQPQGQAVHCNDQGWQRGADADGSDARLPDGAVARPVDGGAGSGAHHRLGQTKDVLVKRFYYSNSVDASANRLQTACAAATLAPPTDSSPGPCSPQGLQGRLSSDRGKAFPRTPSTQPCICRGSTAHAFFHLTKLLPSPYLALPRPQSLNHYYASVLACVHTSACKAHACMTWNLYVRCLRRVCQNTA